MIELAKTEAGISVTPDQLDSDPWLLNCLNGTIDLRTGELHDHRRENLCTKLVPVGFDPEAQCPIWDSFLERILGQNLELIKFLRRAVGYSLTGLTTEQILVFLYGTGANGKTTFIETMRHLFADYSQQADFTTFLEKKNDGPRNDLASLKGARFVAAVEAAEGRQLAEAVIKQTTGGDTIRARFLYHEFFEFKPQFKLFLVANHKPRIAGTDEAIWRRIRLIPFAVTIPKDERDQQLPEKLERELPGILTWAVRGCRSWQKNGLGEPAEVSEATAAYRREMDILADFIEEGCVVGPQEVVDAGQLYKVFMKWCEDSGEEPLTQKKLGEKLRERGFEAGKKRGIRRWKGLRLHHDFDDEAE
jgi:putative DNA primase/helicase